MKLENKVAIITGSTKGIGYAIADLYLKEGAKVVVTGLKDEVPQALKTLEESHKSENILGLELDVTSTESIKNVVEKTIEKFGKIDILINNAGITAAKPLIQTTDEEMERMFQINTFGVFKFIREVAPYMIEQKSGSIINTSSMVANYGGMMQTPYASSKFAVNGITKSCAKELGRHNIRVNAVAPGAVMTDMTKDSTDEKTRGMLSQLTPLGRIANPSELAGAYLYLGSDDSTFTNGTIIQVDGGIVI